MTKINIAVLFGGKSNEYEVSLKSAASVIRNMDSDKYEIIMVGITKTGEWLRFCGSPDEIEQDIWERHDSCLPSFFSPSRQVKGLIELVQTEYRIIPIDVVLPMLHGKFGEDGTLQGLLELAGIPYTGCGCLASAVAMDKDIAHKLVQAGGIAVPHAITVYEGENLEQVIEKAVQIGFPLYVKPVNSGSSIGITKAANRDELELGIRLAFEHDHKVIIEESIEGFEIGCAVLGNQHLTAGVIDEIEIQNGFFNFTEKYSLQTSKIHVPARLDKAKAEEAVQTAKQIYKLLGCSGFSRVDMFVTPQGRIVFNEVNTIPGFTANSRYPKMLEQAGIGYSEIINQLIHLALEGEDQDGVC